MTPSGGAPLQQGRAAPPLHPTHGKDQIVMRAASGAPGGRATGAPERHGAPGLALQRAVDLARRVNCWLERAPAPVILGTWFCGCFFVLSMVAGAVGSTGTQVAFGVLSVFGASVVLEARWRR